MRGIGQRIAEEVWEDASEKGIQILVLDNLEEQIPEGRILAKLQKPPFTCEAEDDWHYVLDSNPYFPTP